MSPACRVFWGKLPDSLRKCKVLLSKCRPAVEVTRMPDMEQSSTLLPVTRAATLNGCAGCGEVN